MIVKQPQQDPLPKDARLRAGVEAERQLAFYLHREFANDRDLLVLNDLRLVDPDQPEHDGRPGVCQIDHLVLHRFGAFIIESKSVTDEVCVRGDGSGGDEWTRKFGGKEHGFASPIQQARRQGEFLRVYLQQRRESLLGRMPFGLRTLSKLRSGTDQRGFRYMPIQIIVAISDHGKIRRINKWTEPTEPFQTYVSKADLVASKIRDQFKKHDDAGSGALKADGKYGVWIMKREEAPIVADFLAARHEPKVVETPIPSETAASGHAPAPKTSAPPVVESPACKACHGTRLVAKSGRYGYYWKCSDCNANTTMPTVCSACGANGQRGKGVRVRKEGPKYYRSCGHCGIDERIWSES